MNSNIEQLYRDTKGGASSRLPLIKSGPNRGRARPETTGTWEYLTGYCHDAPPSSRAIHGGWVWALLQHGYRIGYTTDSGVSYWIWKGP
jgi:hypothetical protein